MEWPTADKPLEPSKSTMPPCSFRFILYNVLVVVQAHPAIEVWQVLTCVARAYPDLRSDTILAYLISFAIIAFGIV